MSARAELRTGESRCFTPTTSTPVSAGDMLRNAMSMKIDHYKMKAECLLTTIDLVRERILTSAFLENPHHDVANWNKEVNQEIKRLNDIPICYVDNYNPNLEAYKLMQANIDNLEALEQNLETLTQKRDICLNTVSTLQEIFETPEFQENPRVYLKNWVDSAFKKGPISKVEEKVGSFYLKTLPKQRKTQPMPDYERMTSRLGPVTKSFKREVRGLEGSMKSLEKQHEKLSESLDSYDDSLRKLQSLTEGKTTEQLTDDFRRGLANPDARAKALAILNSEKTQS
jgi:prefoldin subunit 5